MSIVGQVEEAYKSKRVLMEEVGMQNLPAIIIELYDLPCAKSQYH